MTGRIRLIKPGFFHDAELCSLPPEARLLFSGLWSLADREGRLKDYPKQIKHDVLPADDVDVDALLQVLAQGRYIIRYSDAGVRYIQVRTFLRHQRVGRYEKNSVIPPPPGVVNGPKVHSSVSRSLKLKILKRDKYRCVLCGSSEELHIDHIVEYCDGGMNDPSNLRTLCETCNFARPGKRRVAVA